jgi:uncharacterized protein YhaN
MTRETTDKTTAELRIELRQVREAVEGVLDDYEQTAQTVDALTAQIDAVDTTNHSANVQQMREDLLNALQSGTDTIDPPWVREGYATKQAWLDDQ